MDDYPGLAARVAAGIAGLRGCLILSRDGLVLGAYPGDDDSVAKPGWLKFATLGDPERSFIEFPDQIWVYLRRGPYAAFAVAHPGVRPGLVIDQLEQALLSAEESRTKREGLRAPEPASAAGPRTTLHPTPARATEPAPAPAPAPALTGPPIEPTAASGAPPSRPPAGSAIAEVVATEGAGAPPPPTATEDAPAQTDPEPPTDAAKVEEVSTDDDRPKHATPKLMTDRVTPDRAEEEEEEVDRVLLAQEFSGLLQDLEKDDEGSS